MAKMVAIFCSLAQKNKHPERGYRWHLSCLDLILGQNHAWFWWKSLNGNPNIVIVVPKVSIILPLSPKKSTNGVKKSHFHHRLKLTLTVSRWARLPVHVCVFNPAVLLGWCFWPSFLMKRLDEEGDICYPDPLAFNGLLRCARFSAGSGPCWEWNNAFWVPSLLLLAP